jgi:membrane protein DedA with SNARE-associated domain
MDSIPYLGPIIAFIESSKYLLLFLGSYFEGTVVMLTGGVFLKLGSVQYWPLFWALTAGDALSDIMWYCIGYFGARPFMMRWGHLINVTPPVLEKIERRFHKYHLRILLISKLTMGFGLAAAILASAGMLRVSFWRYVVINVVAGIVWVNAVIITGYYFGNVLVLVPEQYQIGFLIVVITGFFAAMHYLTKRLSEVEW